MQLNPRKYKDFNSMFAAFLGWEIIDGYWYIKDIDIKMGKSIAFHNNWNLIMLVVEKIIAINSGEFKICNVMNNGVAFVVKYDDLSSFEEKTLLLNVYNVCYQFIKKNQ